MSSLKQIMRKMLIIYGNLEVKFQKFRSDADVLEESK
jgi:hypothetical protein